MPRYWTLVSPQQNATRRVPTSSRLHRGMLRRIQRYAPSDIELCSVPYKAMLRMLQRHAPHVGADPCVCPPYLPILFVIVRAGHLLPSSRRGWGRWSAPTCGCARGGLGLCARRIDGLCPRRVDGLCPGQIEGLCPRRF